MLVRTEVVLVGCRHRCFESSLRLRNVDGGVLNLYRDCEI